MISLGNSQLWVHDQDEALDFYVGKLGWEVKSDVTIPEMGFRWLAVGPQGGEVGVVLMPVPGPPLTDEGTKAQIADVVGKGFGGTLFLVTEDVQADFDRLEAAGVEITDKPEQRPYGIDCGLRDPSGNSIRLTQFTASEWTDQVS